MKETVSGPARRQITDQWLHQLSATWERRTGDRVQVRRAAGGEERSPAGEMLWWTGAVPGFPAETVLWVGASKAALASSSIAGSIGEGTSADPGDIFTVLLNESWNCSGELAAGPAPRGPIEEFRISPVNGDPVELWVIFPDEGEPEQARGELDESALGVLLDIELPVTLRFGRTRMVLADVLTLNTGSMVEFDRPLSEPIEVLVNGHVVARGEAVTVQGNYAVRISEIVSRRQRLDFSAGRASEELR